MQTFVVRIHRSEDLGDAPLRGIVEEIASGRKTTFRDAGQLLSILSQRLETEPPVDSEHHSHRRGSL